MQAAPLRPGPALQARTDAVQAPEGALGEAGGPSFSPDRALRLSSRLHCSDRATVPRLLDSGSRRSPHQVSGRASSSRHATPCAGRASRSFPSASGTVTSIFPNSTRRTTPWHVHSVVIRSPASPRPPPTSPASGSLPGVCGPQSIGPCGRAPGSCCLTAGSSARPGTSRRTASAGSAMHLTTASSGFSGSKKGPRPLSFWSFPSGSLPFPERARSTRPD